MRTRNRRGVVLIIVLGMLAILCLLATTFSSLQILERDISRNYLDAVRGRRVAAAGLETAIARIRSTIEAGRLNDPAMLYWGNNLAELGVPDCTTPLEEAANPSYAWEDEHPQDPSDGNVAPKLLVIDGRKVGISGTMASGTYAAHGDVFRLRVSDANSRIHVNDGTEEGSQGNVSRNLRRILNNLGKLLGVEEAGDRIIDGRPADGYRLLRQLRPILGETDFEKLRPFLTTRAWVDSSVCNPVPLSEKTLGAYPVPYNKPLGLQRYGRSRVTEGQVLPAPLVFAPEYADPSGMQHAVYAMDELNAQYIEICRRAPVNVNLAPKEILTALLIHLRGWFLVERRQNNPNGDMYDFLMHRRQEHDIDAIAGDEYGFLYSTVPFTAPDETGTEGISAADVADEIIACRSRLPSPHMGGVDYGEEWYGGPFRAWRQFHAFCDGLVQGGLLRDDRKIYYDYKSLGKFNSQIKCVPSPIQPKVAAQALADVLKANFNPNLTLNELNPDSNLHLLVDKTDLIVNSTEFCFTPMGIFDIESEGLVLRPSGGETDLFQASSAEVISREKIACAVRIFEVRRETSQSDFYDGEAGDRPSSSWVTANNKTMQIGPEPDNGKLPRECTWSGWIQLATIGGHWKGTGKGHPKDTLVSTKKSGAELDAAAHAHFFHDHRLDRHAGGGEEPLRPKSGDYRNNPDRTETAPGPYGPTFGPEGRYRLARAWDGLHPPESPAYVAPSDLRHDGAYVERDSALLYLNTLGTFGLTGTVSYWIKPSFRPEMTGTPRTFFSTDNLRTGSKGALRQAINGHWFLASQDGPAYGPSPGEDSVPIYPSGPWRPSCMVAGFSTSGKIGGGVGLESPSLNHESHKHERPDRLRHHRWVHVTYHWDMEARAIRLLVNGEELFGTERIEVHPTDIWVPGDFVDGKNPFRLGEPSRTMCYGSSGGPMGGIFDGPYSRNWSADSTIDEFYLWKGDRTGIAVNLYELGRYYRPHNPSYGIDADLHFTSQALTLAEEYRSLAPPSALSAPGAAGTGEAAAGPSGGGKPQSRVIGLAWTWYPPSVDEKGKPKIFDHDSELELDVGVELGLVVNGKETVTALDDDGWSPVVQVVGPEDAFHYRVRIRMKGVSKNTILLDTPVVDDVSIYHSSGVEYLRYEVR